MGIYLGIDFGTSTLCITRWKENSNQVEIVPNIIRSGYGKSGPIENVIFYQSEDEYLIGEPALKRAQIDPHHFVGGIKRELDGSGWQRTIRGEPKTAVDVASDIFAYIRSAVEDMYGGEEIDGVVISVPFAFQHRERQRIKLAAQKADLTVVGLIEEPVAAALSSGLFENNRILDGENVLVFDFGGGTLDITVFQKKSEANGKISIEVITTDGNKQLGGKDIDQRVEDKLLALLNIDLSTKINSKHIDKFRDKIRQQAVDLKIALTDDDECEIFFEDDEGNTYDECVGRDTFNEWIQPDYLLRIKEKLEDTLDDVELDRDDIKHIVMVGGSSRIIVVQKLIEEFFERKPIIPKQLDELVGLGAGMYCGMLQSGSSTFNVIQKVSYNTGINVGGKMKSILPRNTVYGEWSVETYIVKTPNVVIYQGNSVILKNCSSIGTIDISSYIDDYASGVGVKLGTTDSGTICYRLVEKGNIVVEKEVEEKGE